MLEAYLSFLYLIRNNEFKVYKMKIILLLIGISLVLALGFLLSFFWAVRSGQYDDDYTPSVRILFDDKEANEKI